MIEHFGRQTFAHEALEEESRILLSFREMFVVADSLTAAPERLEADKKFHHRFHKMGCRTVPG
jgi:hypothetical protein